MFVRLSIFKKNHQQLIAVDLSKQKALDAVQELFGFYGRLKTNSQARRVLEKSKETLVEFYKGIAKVLWKI